MDLILRFVEFLSDKKEHKYMLAKHFLITLKYLELIQWSK
jgi:hypothetical protein